MRPYGPGHNHSRNSELGTRNSELGTATSPRGFAAGDAGLGTDRVDLHQLDRIAIRIVNPGLLVVIGAFLNLAVDLHTFGAQILNLFGDVVGQQTEVAETLGPLFRRRRIGTA